MAYRVSKLAVILVAAGLTSAVARAEEEKPGEIGALWGVAAADEDVTGEATEDFTLGARGGYHFNPRWVWFGDALYAKFDSTSPPVDPSLSAPVLVPSNEDVETLSVRTGLQYLFTPERSRNWFVSFGPGWMRVTRSDLLRTSDGMGGVSEELVPGDFDRLFVSVGGGQRFLVNPELQIHWEIRVDQTGTLRSRDDADDGVGGQGVAQGYLLVGLSWGIGSGD